MDSLVRSVSLLLALALLFYFLKNLFGYASQWVMARMRSDLLFTLRNLLYDKILRLPIGYFSQQKRGDVVSRAVNDTHEIEHTILNALKQFITEPISAALYLVALFYISPKLSVYAILASFFRCDYLFVFVFTDWHFPHSYHPTLFYHFSFDGSICSENSMS